MPDPSLEPLLDLGLSELEAAVYCHLVARRAGSLPLVADALGESTAAVATAFRSLQEKGAAVAAGGDGMVRALPVEEFLARATKRFHRIRRQAGGALRQLSEAPVEERLLMIHSAAEVWDRLTAMLDECQEVALLDLFPLSVEKLRRPLEKAAGRGCHVAVKTYSPTRLDGVQAVHEPGSDDVLRRWRGQWANAVVDGQEFLFAFLSEDGERVYRALWSHSACSGWVYHSALLAEIRLASLLSTDGPGTLRRRRAFRRFNPLQALRPTGQRRLLARHELDEPGSSATTGDP